MSFNIRPQLNLLTLLPVSYRSVLSFCPCRRNLPCMSRFDSTKYYFPFRVSRCYLESQLFSGEQRFLLLIVRAKVLNLPLPKGRGFVRSLTLSPYYYRRGQSTSTRYLLTYCEPFTLTFLVHYTFSRRPHHSSQKSLSAALRREVCVTPYFNLIVLLHFC